MDIDAIKEDVKLTLTELPPDFVGLLLTLAVKYHEIMRTLVPKLIERFKPHFMAGSVEAAAGVLEKDVIERVIAEIIKEVTGVDIRALENPG